MNAAEWVHQIAGYPKVAVSFFVRMMLEGLHRRLARPKVRKALVNSLGETPSLTDLRLISACLLAFSAFLCYDEQGFIWGGGGGQEGAFAPLGS